MKPSRQELITTVFLILAWILLFRAREDISSTDYQLGVAVLAVITVFFVIGRLLEWRARLREGEKGD